MFNSKEAFFRGSALSKDVKNLKDEISTVGEKEIEIPVAPGAVVDKATVYSGAISTQSTLPSLKLGHGKPIKISKIFQDACKDFKLTHAELADILGISVGTINNYLDKKPDIKRAMNHANKLKVLRLNDLLGVLRSGITQAYLRRTILHTPLGVFGDRSAIEFARKISEERRVDELSAILTKMY